jgi:hypothetical protein
MVFYRSFLEAIKKLPTDADKLKAFEMITEYGTGGEVEESGTLADIVFTMAKPQIDANESRKTNGSHGGRPKKTNGFETEKPMVIEDENHRLEDEKPKEKVKDKVKVKEKVKEEGKGKGESEGEPLAPPCRTADYQEIVDAYNQTCVSFPSVKFLSDSRKKAIHARLNTYSLGDFQTMFEKAEKSDFLKGANSRNWSANFDWMIKDANFAKILDGNYDNGTARSSPRGQPDDKFSGIREWLEEVSE